MQLFENKLFTDNGFLEPMEQIVLYSHAFHKVVNVTQSLLMND